MANIMAYVMAYVMVYLAARNICAMMWMDECDGGIW